MTIGFDAITILESHFPPIVVQWIESQAIIKGEQDRYSQIQCLEEKGGEPPIDDDNDCGQSYTYKAYKNFAVFYRCIRDHARKFSILHPLPNKTDRLYNYVEKNPKLLIRKSCALIAIKHFNTDSEIHVRGIEVMFERLERFAKKYGITSIREFGNTWIGTCGFFDPEDIEDIEPGKSKDLGNRRRYLIIFLSM